MTDDANAKEKEEFRRYWRHARSQLGSILVFLAGFTSRRTMREDSKRTRRLAESPGARRPGAHRRLNPGVCWFNLRTADTGTGPMRHQGRKRSLRQNRPEEGERELEIIFHFSFCLSNDRRQLWRSTSLFTVGARISPDS